MIKYYIAPFNMFNNSVLKGDIFVPSGDMYYAENAGFSLPKEIVETWEQKNPYEEMIKEWEASGRKKIVQFFADGEWRNVTNNIPLWHPLEIYRFKSENEYNNSILSDYQELKDENKKLKQDIYSLVCNSDKTDGIEVKLRYELYYKLINNILQDTPTKVTK